MKDIIITSSHTIDGYRIIRYIDFISVEVVIGTGILSEFKASFSDFFGTRSGAFQKKLAKIKSTALAELKLKANSMRGDAIISIDIDYTNFTDNIIGLIISGTVVLLEKKTDVSKTTEIEHEDNFNKVDINCPLYIRSKTIRKQIVKERIENLFVSFSLLNPKALDVRAIKFKIKLFTYFEEPIDLSEQTKIVTDIKKQEEQKILLNIEHNQYDLISHIEVVVEKISLQNQDDWISKGNIIKSNISDIDSYIYQAYFGFDAICYPQKDKENWTCVCGNINSLRKIKCSNCSREKYEVLLSKEIIIAESTNIITNTDSQLTNKTVWNRKDKMHARINKRINKDEIEVYNKYGIFIWRIIDCDLEKQKNMYKLPHN